MIPPGGPRCVQETVLLGASLKPEQMESGRKSCTGIAQRTQSILKIKQQTPAHVSLHKTDKKKKAFNHVGHSPMVEEQNQRKIPNTLSNLSKLKKLTACSASGMLRVFCGLQSGVLHDLVLLRHVRSIGIWGSWRTGQPLELFITDCHAVPELYLGMSLRASPWDIKGHCKDKMQKAHNQTLKCDELGQEQVVKTEKEKRGLDLSFTKGLATYCTLNLRRRHPFNRYTGMKQWWFSASILTSFYFSQSQDRPSWQGFLISIFIIVWL